MQRRRRFAGLERNLFATPLFWAGIAFLTLLAVAGSPTVAGSGPSPVGAIAGILVALAIMAVGVVPILAVAASQIPRSASSDGDRAFG